MADSENKKIDFEDEIFRLLWDSFNAQDDIPINPQKQAPKETLPKLYELTKSARSYDEFRNILINHLQKLGEKGLEDEELNNAISYYNGANGDTVKGISFSKDMFPPYSSLKMKQIVGQKNGADGLSVDEVLEQAEKIYTALMADREKLNHLFVPKDDDYLKYLDDGNFSERKFANETIKKYFESRNLSEQEKDRIAQELDIRPKNEDYLNNYISSILLRASKIGKDEKRRKDYPVASTAGDFLAPNSMKKQQEGLNPNTADKFADVLPYGVGGVAAKTGLAALNKGEKIPFLKSAIAATGAGVGLDYLHDIADSVLTKHVYSEIPNQEISSRGDYKKVASEFGDYLLRGVGYLPMALVLGGLSTANSVVGGTRKILSSGLDKLFGKGKAKKELESINKKVEVAKEKAEKEYKSAMDRLTEREMQLKNNQSRLNSEKKQAFGKNGSEDERAMNVADFDQHDKNIRLHNFEKQATTTAYEKALKDAELIDAERKALIEKQLAKADAIKNGLYFLATGTELANSDEKGKVNALSLLKYLRP